MILINNQPFINLDPHLDIESFDLLHEKISYGIAKSYKFIVPCPVPKYNIYEQHLDSYFDTRQRDSISHPELSFHELNTYSMMKGSAFVGSELSIKDVKAYPDDYRFKNLDRYTEIKEAGKNFNFLFDWIDKQRCFSEYGRVIFFISMPGQKGIIHNDYGDFKHKKDQFVWITGKVKKSFFIYDDLTNTKIYNTGRAIIFNNCDYHGTENENHYVAWSLRIDGVFKDEWAKKINLENWKTKE